MKICRVEMIQVQQNLLTKCINPLTANPKNGQTHSINSPAVADELLECV